MASIPKPLLACLAYADPSHRRCIGILPVERATQGLSTLLVILRFLFMRWLNGQLLGNRGKSSRCIQGSLLLRERSAAGAKEWQ